MFDLIGFDASWMCDVAIFCGEGRTNEKHLKNCYHIL